MIQNYHQQKLARWGGRHLSTSSPRKRDKNTYGKNWQDGEDDICLPPPQGRVTKTPPAKTGKMGRTTLCLLPLQQLFQQKIDQMGRTTLSLPPPQGRKRGQDPDP